MKTDFDGNIGNIKIIPQDIRKVILNLTTNAFYVADEKKKQIGDGYEPTVSVSTKNEWHSRNKCKRSWHQPTTKSIG